jgi:hypothetical protein
MTQRDRAERKLIAATSTAESMTIDMAKEFRNRTGMPADLTRKVLDRAEELLQQMTRAGEDTPYLRRSRGVVLTELPTCPGRQRGRVGGGASGAGHVGGRAHHGVATGPVDHR